MNLQEQKNIYLNSGVRMNPELENQIKSNSLDLAKNPAFPKTDASGNQINFLELIAYKRFNDVVSLVKRYNPQINPASIGEVSSVLMGAVRTITNAEQPHIPKLEKLAVDVVVNEMEIPDGAFLYDAKIVPVGSISGEGFILEGKEQNQQEVQSQFGEQAEVENMTASELFEMEKHKRRFINMLIQGASKKGHYMFQLVAGELNEINPQMTNEYGKMMSANDIIYWLFPDETIKQMASQPSNMAGKEEIEDETDPPTLKVRGINFPVVVHELVKAIMDVFGTQGLPDDPKSSQMIIDSVDSLENETMDLRLGVPVWELFSSSYPAMVFEEGNRHIQHYLFARFCALEINEFFRVARLILSQSQEGSKYMERMANEIVKDLQNQDYNTQFGDDTGYSLDDILGYANGGFAYVDLFEDYENIPQKVQVILDKYAKKFGDDLGEMDYSDMAEMHKEIQGVGYTFESYLDNVPYGLRPIGVNLNELQGYEDEEDDKMENGGFAYVDLFEDYENIPANVKAILNDYELEDSDYNTLNDLQNELAEVGYTFEFGLDAEPFALRPIGVEVNELQGYEDYEKGNFKSGGEANFDIYDYDKKMALINLGEIYEYAIKIDKMIDEDTDLEEWVKMKLSRIEQSIADVKHSLEGWEKYKNGGEIPKKQLLHIAKYSKDLIEMIQGGSRLMSWQEDKLAISSASIDDIYHHLDYKMGNRAEDLDIENEEGILYRRGGKATKKLAKTKFSYDIKKQDGSFVVFFMYDDIFYFGVKTGFDTKEEAIKYAKKEIQELREIVNEDNTYFYSWKSRMLVEQIPLGRPMRLGVFNSRQQAEKVITKRIEMRMKQPAQKRFSHLKFNGGGETTLQDGVYDVKDRYTLTLKNEGGDNWHITIVDNVRKATKIDKVVPKHIAILESLKIGKIFPSSDDKYAGGGEIEDWMQSALYQLQAEEDNDNLQISFVKNNEFTCQDDDANEYRVFKNEDVAEEMAVEEVREDLEYQPEMFNRDFLMDFVDVDDFLVLDIENANYDYVKDIEDESNDKYANRLIAELVDNGLISENEALTTDPTDLSDDYSQDYINLLTSEQIGDDNGIEYFIDNFGEDEFFKIVIDNNLIDFDNASKDAVNMDGIAHFLARYDGETIYLDNNVVAYRTN
jgi:hypothetical protein